MAGVLNYRQITVTGKKGEIGRNQQVRAQDTTTALIEFTVAYIDAVRDVSKR
ncbi:hypothetical protein [Novosphingobium guangzhouense]|uniref:hypothetical protein n=1 Tax=Novosphingobium guangzhouense TaxID=1850347 RepID=UPI0014739A22|nr:hypothetical protein [Novosphingobium guangzhouense]